MYHHYHNPSVSSTLSLCIRLLYDPCMIAFRRSGHAISYLVYLLYLSGGFRFFLTFSGVALVVGGWDVG